MEWRGLDEFRRALRELPRELAGEAAGDVETAARMAEASIRGGYPVRTGRLQRGVRLEMQRSTFGARARVISRAPHAGLYERGTVERRTRRGYNRGAMPKGTNPAVPEMIRQRRAMHARLIGLLRRAGFEVRT